MTDTTTVVTEDSAKSVPSPVGNQSTLEVASAAQTGSGALSVEVFNLGKCVFPNDEFANFDFFVNFSDDDDEGLLYPDLATAGS